MCLLWGRKWHQYALPVYPTSTVALFPSQCDSTNAATRPSTQRTRRQTCRPELGHFESRQRLRVGLTAGQQRILLQSVSQAAGNPVSPTLFSSHCVRQLTNVMLLP
jgi:hypothetical protein